MQSQMALRTIRKRTTRNRRPLSVESLEARQVLSAAGWAIALGGPTADTAYDVGTDNAGNAYVGGEVDDEFLLAKYDASGSQLWNRTGVSSNGGSSSIQQLEVDSAGNSYVGGWFSGEIDFDGGISLTAADNGDGFLAKYDASGNLQWVQQQSDYAHALEIREDPVGGTHIYLTGLFRESLTYDQVEIVSNTFGYDSTFLIDVIDTGTSGVVAGAIQVQDQGRLQPRDLAVNSSGDIYLIGEFSQGGDGPNATYPIASIGGELLTSFGYTDPFLAKFSSDLTVEWAYHLGGNRHYDHGAAVALDADGNLYVTGNYLADMEIGGVPLPHQPIHWAVYIAKLADTGSGPQVLWAKGIGGHEDQGSSGPYSLIIDESAGPETPSLYIAGEFFETVDFDPDPNQDHFLTSTTPGGGAVHDTGYQGFLLHLSGDGEFEDVWQFGYWVNEAAVSADGTVFAAGEFSDDSSVMVTQNLRSAGGRDGFLTRIDPDAPVVQLATNGIVTEGIAASFTAVANDMVDGDLSSGVDWTLNGVAIASDTSTVSVNGLNVGIHTLVGTVIDSDGIMGSYTFTFDVVPAAPTSLIAASINATSVTLAWTDQSAGETGFVIERALQPKGKGAPVWQQVGQVAANATSFTDSNVPSGNYIYRVRAIAEIAIDEVLCSAWSDLLNVSLGGSGGGGKGGGKPR